MSLIIKNMVYKRLTVNCFGKQANKCYLSDIKEHGKYRVSRILTYIYFFSHLEPTDIALLHRQVLIYLIH